MNKIDILAEYYPLDDLIRQNEVNPVVIVTFLVDEGLIDLEDYFYDDGNIIEEELTLLGGRNGPRPGY